MSTIMALTALWLNPIWRPSARVVNATLKKYWRYRYSNLKVSALPVPLLKFKSIGATATATLSRNSYMYNQRRVYIEWGPRRKHFVGPFNRDRS